MRGTYIILSLAASLSLLVTACSLNPLTNDIKVKEVDVNIISEDHKMSLYHGQPDTQVTLSKLEYRIYLQEGSKSLLENQYTPRILPLESLYTFVRGSVGHNIFNDEEQIEQGFFIPVKGPIRENGTLVYIQQYILGTENRTSQLSGSPEKAELEALRDYAKESHFVISNDRGDDVYRLDLRDFKE
ncbi:hypothetical protein ACFPU1_03230 [Thalassorhabdus alkalitolerans]|uniref:Uncharacterized protein n=1 Tax=Thalassorhabdus alkalitolerans TaxID=2282697 RepID=A0ABW0YK72_9BACI